MCTHIQYIIIKHLNASAATIRKSRGKHWWHHACSPAQIGSGDENNIHHLVPVICCFHFFCCKTHFSAFSKPMKKSPLGTANERAWRNKNIELNHTVGSFAYSSGSDPANAALVHTHLEQNPDPQSLKRQTKSKWGKKSGSTQDVTLSPATGRGPA